MLDNYRELLKIRIKEVRNDIHNFDSSEYNDSILEDLFEELEYLQKEYEMIEVI